MLAFLDGDITNVVVIKCRRRRRRAQTGNTTIAQLGTTWWVEGSGLMIMDETEVYSLVDTYLPLLLPAMLPANVLPPLVRAFTFFSHMSKPSWNECKNLFAKYIIGFLLFCFDLFFKILAFPSPFSDEIYQNAHKNRMMETQPVGQKQDRRIS